MIYSRFVDAGLYCSVTRIRNLTDTKVKASIKQLLVKKFNGNDNGKAIVAILNDFSDDHE